MKKDSSGWTYSEGRTVTLDVDQLSVWHSEQEFIARQNPERADHSQPSVPAVTLRMRREAASPHLAVPLQDCVISKTMYLGQYELDILNDGDIIEIEALIQWKSERCEKKAPLFEKYTVSTKETSKRLFARSHARCNLRINSLARKLRPRPIFEDYIARMRSAKSAPGILKIPSRFGGMWSYPRNRQLIHFEGCS